MAFGPKMTVDRWGNRNWWLDGQRHRDNGPAYQGSNGDQFWYMLGQLHRVDGPAVRYADGTLEWRLKGQRHRIDGPGVEFPNGIREWWLNDQKYEFVDWVKVLPISDQQQLVILLKYSH